MSGVSLCEITEQNREAVLALRVAPSQDGYVSSVADSLEEAHETPEGNPWYRAIYADDQERNAGTTANHRAMVSLEASNRRAASRSRIRA